jgi:hypothetical protein
LKDGTAAPFVTGGSQMKDFKKHFKKTLNPSELQTVVGGALAPTCSRNVLARCVLRVNVKAPQPDPAEIEQERANRCCTHNWADPDVGRGESATKAIR